MTFKIDLLLLAVCLVTITCKSNHKSNLTTVIEIDHFSSQKERFTTYNISDAEVNKSLITTLRPKDSSDLYTNPITIKLTSGSEETTCKFKSYSDLCVLEKVQQLPPRMRVECEKVPCDVYFTNYQAPIIESLESQKLDELYRLDSTSNHTILMFKCNDPDIKDYDNEIKIYSNQQFNRTYINNMVYAFFRNNGKGYVYVEASEKVQTCTKMLTYNITNKLTNLTKVKDFVESSSANTYTFSDKPKDSDIRIDISVLGFDKTQLLKGNLKLELLGKTDSDKTDKVIQSYLIGNSQNKTVLNIDTIFKKQVFEKYNNLSLRLTSPSQIVMINMQIEYASIHEIDPDEISYFSLQKGDKLLYTLNKNNMPSGNVEVELMNDNGKLQSNTKTCNITDGCHIEITAKDSVDQASLKLKLSNAVQKYVPVVGSVRSRIREGETLYYTFKAKAQKEAEITVNSENVIIYVGDKKCPIPSQTCNNYTSNFKEAIFIEPDQDTDFYIAITSLDDTIFTLRVMENTDEYIDLVDGEPFSYSLKQADRIGFTFKIKEKTDTQFNLIAPLNSLYLYVSNSDKLPTGGEEDLKSGQGNILMKKDELNGTTFSILIQKVNNKTEKVSFTLIASTSKAIVPLEPSVSLYDNLQSKQPKVYLVNYKRNDTNVINFYLFGTATMNIMVDVRVAKTLKDLADSKESMKISNTQQLLELEGFADDFCSKDKSELCELYMRIQNQENNEIDVVLTHMIQDSIIELKDGIWQSFSLTVTTSSTHFYFAPKHQNKSITILYNTTYQRLRLSYKLWKNTESRFDPSKWPFPEDDNQSSIEPFNHLRQISVSPEPLKQCWPDCVILFTLLGIDRTNISNITAWDDKRVNDTFSIMASNDIIELMEHEKIDLILHDKEQKEIFVDLKYFLSKERLTFFTSSTFGAMIMYGCVSSNSKPRVPTPTEFDFNFGYVETQIPMSKIKSKLEELSIIGDRELSLRIVIMPLRTTKMSIEFTSKEDLIKQLHYEIFDTIQINKDQERMFQLVPIQDYHIRLIRIKGFPFIDWKVCNNTELEQCIDQLTNPIQMASKTQLIDGKRETGKIVVLKVQAKELIELDLYVQSPLGELQLKEGKTFTDFCNKGQKNKYSMIANKEQETVITVTVMEGNPTVRAWTNFKLTPIVKTKKESNIIHIAIPPHKERNTSASSTAQVINWYINRFDSLGLNSLLETIHLQIQDKDTNASYTISYTSGERGMQLEDGMITSSLIQPGRNVTLFYDNANKELSLVATISFESAEELQQTQIKLSYGNQQNSFDQQNPETPEIKKKTPHPTMVFKLPTGYVYYEVFLTNTGKTNSSVSVLINQDEVIILPYQVEYPVVLKPEQKQHLLVEVSNEGFLLLIVRKCDEGVPILSYSFDYDATLRDEYQYESPIKDDVRQEIFIKPKIGTLYIKFTVDVESVFSVMVQYYRTKAEMPRDSAKIGNQGVIDYQLINSIDAQMSFLPLSCNNRPCPHVKYEHMSSTSLHNLYSQLVCPSHFFSFSEASPPLTAQSIKVGSNTNVSEPVKFEYRLMDQISYFGIRAIMENGREYLYKPIQIVTIWGHIARNKRYHNFVITLFLACILFCICMLLRRRHRKGYGQLKEQDDPSEVQSTGLRRLE